MLVLSDIKIYHFPNLPLRKNPNNPILTILKVINKITVISATVTYITESPFWNSRATLRKPLWHHKTALSENPQKIFLQISNRKFPDNPTNPHQKTPKIKKRHLFSF